MNEKTYALILNGVVRNIMVAAPEVALNWPGFDEIREISTTPGSPGIGWQLVNGELVAPTPEE